MILLAIPLTIYLLLLMSGKYLDRFLWSPFLVWQHVSAAKQENDRFSLGVPKRNELEALGRTETSMSDVDDLSFL